MRRKVRFYSWFVWSLGALFFLIQYIPRISPSILVNELMRTFHVGAFSLGSLSAFFLVAYIGMQIPVGMLLDRFNVSRLLFFAAIIAGIGTMLFVSTNHLQIANFSRFLMGFGSSFAFVGAMKLANLWVPSRYYGLLAGLTQGLGMLGAAIGDAPTVILMSKVGWKNTLKGFAVAFVVLAVLIKIFVKTKKIEENAEEKKGFGVWEGLCLILQNPQSWLNAFYLGLMYAPTMAFAELWGVDFLRHIYHLSHDASAFAVGLIFIGWAIGGPIIGRISDHMSRRKPMMIVSAILSCIFISVVIFGRGFSFTVLCVLLFLYGLSNTGVAVSYALSIEINPKKMAATSIAFANMASIIIGAVFQPLIGWFLEIGWKGQYENGVPLYATSSYIISLIILPIAVIIAGVIVFFIKDSRCQESE